MPVLDIFNNDAFSTVSMSEAIDLVEHVPNHIGGLGVFNDHPVRTEVVGVENRQGKLSIIQTSQRGEPLETKKREKRALRDFRSRRIAKSVRVLASELQFIRAMGEEQAVISVQKEIARRLNGPNGLIADVETTWENLRLGGIQRIVLDADKTTIYNFHNEFEIEQHPVLNFALGTKKDGDLRAFITKNLVRAMRRAAKGQAFRGVYALCGDEYWDLLIKNPEIRET